MTINIQQAKKLINNLELSDKEIENILSASRMFAEILFEKWRKEKRRLFTKK